MATGIIRKLIPIGNGATRVFYGTYVYNGSSTNSVSFTRSGIESYQYFMATCQDAGAPIWTISKNGTTITVVFSQSVTSARINYIAWL